jgi:hypothetical protein
MARLRPWIRVYRPGSRVRKPLTLHWSRSAMTTDGQTARVKRNKCYGASTADGFSRPLRLALGVAVRSVCESDVTEGDSMQSGTMIVSRNFFRVPERDREWDGSVAEDLVLLRGVRYRRQGIGIPSTVEIKMSSSVWVQTCDWLGTVRGATDTTPRFTKAVI